MIKITDKGITFIKTYYGDGWTILKPEGVPWSDLGLTSADKKLLVRTYESNESDPKGTITKDGVVQKKVTGVYLLSLWWRIANVLGCKVPSKLGRGSQARELQSVILERVTK